MAEVRVPNTDLVRTIPLASPWDAVDRDGFDDIKGEAGDLCLCEPQYCVLVVEGEPIGWDRLRAASAVSVIWVRDVLRETDAEECAYVRCPDAFSLPDHRFS
ncbi:hypothetical protein [Streptomyces albogriseolus]|uniref:hypothetical protein n=1 Tax=Streptomyces albogriseolus TaxID=1887 RepID=UPI00382C97B6